MKKLKAGNNFRVWSSCSGVVQECLYFDYVERRVTGDSVVAYMKKLPNADAFFAKDSGTRVEEELKIRNLDRQELHELLQQNMLISQDQHRPQEARNKANYMTQFIRFVSRSPFDWLVGQIELAQQFH